MTWLEANEACSVELAIIISYPKIASGKIILLKTPTKYLRIRLDFICKNNQFSACHF